MEENFNLVLRYTDRYHDRRFVDEYQRRCKWCGHNQILTKWTETKVIEHEQWNDISV